MVAVNSLAAFAAVLGIGSAASAAMVSFSKTFMNNTSTTQTYTYSTYLPVLEGFPSAFMNGQITANLVDLNGNGATFQADGSDAVYTALINGNAVQTLWQAPFSHSAVAYGSSTAPIMRFLPTQITVAENIQAIEVQIRLRLSARDMVTVNGNFEVVPAPGAMLAIAGASGLVGLRRRRR